MQGAIRFRFPAVLVGAASLLSLPAFAADTAQVDAAASPAIAVTNCNDSGPGSLRDTIAGAPSGATIDMSSLACREIVLTSGAIAVAQDDLSLVGGPPGLMKVDAERRSSIFRHSGAGTLHIHRMNIARGVYESDTSPRGGCLYSAGNLELVDSVVHGCRTRGIKGVVVAAGGAIWAGGTVSLVRSRVTDNLVLHGSGGALRAYGGLKVFHSTICRNQSDVALGVLFSGNGLVARNMTLCDNKGSGLWVQNGTILLENSTISGNVGANIVVLRASPNTGSMALVNSTISGNTDTYGTPIVDFQGGAPKSISNSTIAFNQQWDHCGPEVGTVRVMGPDPLLLDSTIIANNDCNGVTGDAITKPATMKTTVVGANNLVTGPSNMPLPADTLAVDPRLAALADNGGPTLTHALPADSPAVDAGSNTLKLGFDQRGSGHPRVQGGQADIGAYER